MNLIYLLVAIVVFVLCFAGTWWGLDRISDVVRARRKREPTQKLEDILPYFPVKAVYEYYDFPVVFTTVSPFEDTYLNIYVHGTYVHGTYVNDANNSKLFLCKRLSLLDHVLLKTRKMTLREFLCSQKDRTFLITDSLTSRVKRAEHLEKIPVEWLPAYGVFLVDEAEASPKYAAPDFEQAFTRASERNEASNHNHSSTVFVCPERDIECGGISSNWCSTCPKRAAR